MSRNMRGKVIEAGYPWRLRIQFANSMTFDADAEFTMHVRAKADDPAPIIVLTTQNDGILRIDDTTLEIRIPETSPAIWPAGKTVVMDLVRTDLPQNEHLGLLLQVPVRNPVTRL